MKKNKFCLFLLPMFMCGISSPKLDIYNYTKQNEISVSVKRDVSNNFDHVKQTEKKLIVMTDSYEWPIFKAEETPHITLKFTTIPPYDWHISDVYVFSEEYIKIYYIKNPKDRNYRKRNYLNQPKKFLKKIGPERKKTADQRHEVTITLKGDEFGRFGYIVFDYWFAFVERFNHKKRRDNRLDTRYFAVGYHLDNSEEEYKGSLGKEIYGRGYTTHSDEFRSFVGYKRSYEMINNQKIPQKITNNNYLDISKFIYKRSYKYWQPFLLKRKKPIIPGYKNVVMYLKIYGKDHDVYSPYQEVTNYYRNQIILPIKLIPKYSEENYCIEYNEFALEFDLNGYVLINNRRQKVTNKAPIPLHDARKTEIFYSLIIDEVEDKSVEKVEIPLTSNDYINEIGGNMTSKVCVVVDKDA